MWGMVCIAVSIMAAAYGRSRVDSNIMPRLPKLLTPFDALIASVGLYGFFMIGVLLIFVPLML